MDKDDRLRRTGVITLAILLALVGAILPLGAAFYLSFIRAVQLEKDYLADISQRALTRAFITFVQANSALQSLANTPVKRACSPAHINLMRKITLDNRVIEEVGYFKQDRLICTTWGPVQGKLSKFTADYVTAYGVEASFDAQSSLHDREHFIALKYKNYQILIEPQRFVDVIVDPDIQIAIVTRKGQVLGQLNHPDPTLIKTLLTEYKENQIHGSMAGYLVGIAQKTQFLVFSLEPKSRVYDNFKQTQLFFLPFGLLIALFVIGMVVYYSRQRLSLLGELAVAIENHELIAHYQPIVDLKTGQCIGAEALARWRRPDGWMVKPYLFIPQAEDSGLILGITDKIIEAIIEELGPFLSAHPSLHMSINLSPRDIQSGRILDVLHNKLKGTGIQPSQIWLEATERGFLEAQSAKETLTRAREAGYIVAIDDFGTGYSSLSYLQNFPLDILKIDKSFIDTIGIDAASSSVTPHIIEMAKTLNLAVVAEGIEKPEQVDYLVHRHVEFGQGWLFSKALSAEQFIAFCETHS
ncbi:EAL domain-containing protein [Legionella rubrilucens]|uniref:EAL domain-containing protein n=1 Tax=Legionella rubrilucens TaxID=458 RepID=UPI00192CE871|nr:EAL domain-containing protein [Legionella rubrilucens]